MVWYLYHDKFMLSTNAAVSVATYISSVATNIEQITVEYTCTHFFMQIISYNFILELKTKSPKMIGHCSNSWMDPCCSCMPNFQVLDFTIMHDEDCSML